MILQKLIIITISLAIFQNVNGLDNTIHKDDQHKDFKQETRFSNGTVVGKYFYSDNQGNPVHVKYFADGDSYGVELKSVKVEVNNHPASQLLSADKEYLNKSDKIYKPNAMQYLSPYSTHPYNMYNGLQRMYDDGEQRSIKSNRNKRKSRKFV